VCMIKKVLYIFIITLTLVFLTISSNASEIYGFKAIQLSSDEKELIWNGMDIKTLNADFIKENNYAIVGFDVSEDECILLALEENTIIIIDKNNEILNCFKFNNNGSYYVKWNGNNILLLLVRSSLIIELTTEGQLVNIIETDTNDVNNNKLWRAVKQREISINDNKYIIRNKLGPLNIIVGSYSQLVKTDNMGKEFIIYDVNTEQLIKAYVSLIFIVVFFVLILRFILKPVKRQTHQGRPIRGRFCKTGDGSVSYSQKS